MGDAPDFKAFMSRNEKLVCPACGRPHDKAVPRQDGTFLGPALCMHCGHMVWNVSATECRNPTKDEIIAMRAVNIAYDGLCKRLQAEIVEKMFG